MDVREDGIIGANDFGMRRHSHVRLEILGGITGRIGDVETKRERNAGAERLPIALPNDVGAVGKGEIRGAGWGGGGRIRRGSGPRRFHYRLP